MAGRQRGAAAVEFAIVGSLLFALIFGIVEMGLAFRTRHTVRNAALEGARSASIGSVSSFADYRTLQAVSANLSAIGVDAQRIVIYRANGRAEAGPTDGCKSGAPSATGPNPCNVYTPFDFTRPETDFGCSDVSPDRFWCPSDRESELGRLDQVGVWISADHDFATGFLGDGFTYTTFAVLPVEPMPVAD